MLGNSDFSCFGGLRELFSLKLAFAKDVSNRIQLFGVVGRPDLDVFNELLQSLFLTLS